MAEVTDLNSTFLFSPFLRTEIKILKAKLFVSTPDVIQLEWYFTSEIFLLKTHSPNSKYEKNIRQTQTKGHSTKQLIFYKKVFLKSVKNKDHLTNCHRLDGTKKTGQLSALRYLG